ncbi:IclR family transcriptional regulator [Saccharospirillum alexandrii]|uniref:IclR family transcriptional regulator n=1 Tax=Saccharospirillum alexandrii TaxID=2448477 RepID=UPI0016FCD6B2
MTNQRREKGSSIQRVLDIIRTVSLTERGVSLPALIEELDIPKATVHRLVQQLEEAGFLQTNLRGNVVPGSQMQAIALGVLNSNEVKIQRQAILQGLAREVDETCGISIPDGINMLYYDRVQANWPLQVHLPVGSHVPINCTASGKLYLSSLSKAARQKVIRNLPLEKRARHTITDPEALNAELDRIKARGYATDNEEFIDGMVAVSVPVLRENGQVIACLFSHGPVIRCSLEELEGHIPALQRAAKELSQVLSAPGEK